MSLVKEVVVLKPFREILEVNNLPARFPDFANKNFRLLGSIVGECPQVDFVRKNTCLQDFVHLDVLERLNLDKKNESEL